MYLKKKSLTSLNFSGSENSGIMKAYQRTFTEQMICNKEKAHVRGTVEFVCAPMTPEPLLTVNVSCSFSTYLWGSNSFTTIFHTNY